MAKKKINWEKQLLEEVIERADPSFMGDIYWEFQGEIGGLRFTVIGKRKKNGKWKLHGWHDGW